jgi:hypothetical protein
MNTVLLISATEALREAWCLEARGRGLTCRHAAALHGALDLLTDPALSGIVFQSDDDDELAALTALSMVCPLPPVVIVSGPTAMPMATRVTAGTIVDPSTSCAGIVDRLACLVRARPLSSPTHLPVRLSRAADAQWTVRLSAKGGPPDDDDSFDGATQPDGFEIALRSA